MTDRILNVPAPTIEQIAEHYGLNASDLSEWMDANKDNWRGRLPVGALDSPSVSGWVKEIR